MSTFPIDDVRYQACQLDVRRYTASPRGGFAISVHHNVPTAPGKQLRWIQTVQENGSVYRLCGLRPYPTRRKTSPLMAGI